MQTRDGSIRPVFHRIAGLVLVVLAGCMADTRAPPSNAPQASATASASAPPCTFCPKTSADGCTLCVRQNPLLAVTSEGVASGSLRICNEGSAPLTPALALSDFTVPASGGEAFALPATSRLSAATAADEPIVNGTSPLAPRQCIAVKLDATGLLQAGPMTATLLDGKQKLVDVKAVRLQAPFDLRIEGPTPERLDLSIARGEKARIVLRNADPLAYRFLWRLELGSQVLSGEAVALPNRLVELAVALDESQFGFLESGFLRSGERQGRLVLQHEPDPSFRVLALPQKTYPVNAHLNYWSSVAQRIWNAASILVVLLIGIVVSLLINYALPMQRERIAVKQQLAEQDGRLGGLGSVISSRSLNLLRVEKKRLRNELQSLWPIDPATEAALPRLKTRVRALGRRIELTVGIGDILKALEGDTALSQIEIDDADRLCRQVLQVAEKPEPTDDDFSRAQAALDRASLIRSTRDEKPAKEQVDAMQARAAAVRADPAFTTGTPEEWKPFAELLIGLRKKFLAEKEPEPSRERFVDAANAVSKVENIVRYATLIDTAGNSEVRAARLGRSQHFLAAVLPGKDESAAQARQLLRQIEQNVSSAEIQDALIANKPGELRIEVDPLTPRHYQLVLFRVHLRSPGFDTSAAREMFKWAWSVDDGPQLLGQDWTTWHFFEPRGTANKVMAWWRRVRNKKAVATAADFTVKAAALNPADPDHPFVTLQSPPIRLEMTKSYGESSTMLSIASLAITVLLVGLGLLAGAQEKLQSMDWVSGLVAIVLLGFGADVLKRAILKP